MIKKVFKRILYLSLSIAGAFNSSACIHCQGGLRPHDCSYDQISQQTAWEIMKSHKDVIIIDARTQEEYDTGHIAGAILIPHDKISEQAEQIIPDKHALILVYCRSGNRSKTACERLVKLGYQNVKEFGGINTWQYGIVTE